MKTVIVLNGEIINVGEWDYQIIEIDGESVAHNPLPKGAAIEERDMVYSEEFGWREVGISVPPTETELLKQENALLKAQVQETNERANFHEELIAELAMMIFP